MFRPICNGCKGFSAWEPFETTEQTAQRLFELAQGMSMANGVMRVLCATGKRYDDAERDYQEAVGIFRRALTEALHPNYARINPEMNEWGSA